jgi:CheY-like chemotaxis protein
LKKKYQVLVIDDDDMYREMVLSMLENEALTIKPLTAVMRQ